MPETPSGRARAWEPAALSRPPDPRYEAMRADVAARLRHVCAEMTPEQFDGLVHDICRVKVRWDDDSASTRRRGA
jgi:hypothetical protein